MGCRFKIKILMHCLLRRVLVNTVAVPVETASEAVGKPGRRFADRHLLQHGPE